VENLHDAGNVTARILAKMLRETLNSAPDATTYADVVADVKARAGRIRLKWTADDVSEALRLVGSNRPIVVDSTPRRLVDRLVPEPPIVSRPIARSIVVELRRRDAARKWKGCD
jgi:hypothetical protein